MMDSSDALIHTLNMLRELRHAASYRQAAWQCMTQSLLYCDNEQYELAQHYLARATDIDANAIGWASR